MQPTRSLRSSSRVMHQLRRSVRGAALLLAAGPALVVGFADPVGAQPVDGEILSREIVTLEADAPEWAVKNSEGVRVERIIYASDGLERSRDTSYSQQSPGRSPSPASSTAAGAIETSVH